MKREDRLYGFIWALLFFALEIFVAASLFLWWQASPPESFGLFPMSLENTNSAIFPEASVSGDLRPGGKIRVFLKTTSFPVSSIEWLGPKWSGHTVLGLRLENKDILKTSMDKHDTWPTTVSKHGLLSSWIDIPFNVPLEFSYDCQLPDNVTLWGRRIGVYWEPVIKYPSSVQGTEERFIRRTKGSRLLKLGYQLRGRAKVVDSEFSKIQSFSFRMPENDTDYIGRAKHVKEMKAWDNFVFFFLGAPLVAFITAFPVRAVWMRKKRD